MDMIASKSILIDEFIAGYKSVNPNVSYNIMKEYANYFCNNEIVFTDVFDMKTQAYKAGYRKAMEE